MVEPPKFRELLDDFRRYYEKLPAPPAPADIDLPEFWAVTALDDLAHEDPDAAWLLILELTGQPLTDLGFSCLAAGPLEDLIDAHGPLVIDRIEARAESDPKFRQLLGGVWESSTPEVWSRVLACRGDPW